MLCKTIENFQASVPSVDFVPRNLVSSLNVSDGSSMYAKDKSQPIQAYQVNNVFISSVKNN